MQSTIKNTNSTETQILSSSEEGEIKQQLPAESPFWETPSEESTSVGAAESSAFAFGSLPALTGKAPSLASIANPFQEFSFTPMPSSIAAQDAASQRRAEEKYPERQLPSGTGKNPKGKKGKAKKPNPGSGKVPKNNKNNIKDANKQPKTTKLSEKITPKNTPRPKVQRTVQSNAESSKCFIPETRSDAPMHAKRLARNGITHITFTKNPDENPHYVSAAVRRYATTQAIAQLHKLGVRHVVTIWGNDRDVGIVNYLNSGVKPDDAIKLSGWGPDMTPADIGRRTTFSLEDVVSNRIRTIDKLGFTGDFFVDHRALPTGAKVGYLFVNVYWLGRVSLNSPGTDRVFDDVNLAAFAGQHPCAIVFHPFAGLFGSIEEEGFWVREHDMDSVMVTHYPEAMRAVHENEGSLDVSYGPHPTLNWLANSGATGSHCWQVTGRYSDTLVSIFVPSKIPQTAPRSLVASTFRANVAVPDYTSPLGKMVFCLPEIAQPICANLIPNTTVNGYDKIYTSLQTYFAGRTISEYLYADALRHAWRAVEEDRHFNTLRHLDPAGANKLVLGTLSIALKTHVDGWNYAQSFHSDDSTAGYNEAVGNVGTSSMSTVALRVLAGASAVAVVAFMGYLGYRWTTPSLSWFNSAKEGVKTILGNLKPAESTSLDVLRNTGGVMGWINRKVDKVLGIWPGIKNSVKELLYGTQPWYSFTQKASIVSMVIQTTYFPSLVDVLVAPVVEEACKLSFEGMGTPINMLSFALSTALSLYETLNWPAANLAPPALFIASAAHTMKHLKMAHIGHNQGFLKAVSVHFCHNLVVVGSGHLMVSYPETAAVATVILMALTPAILLYPTKVTNTTMSFFGAWARAKYHPSARVEDPCFDKPGVHALANGSLPRLIYSDPKDSEMHPLRHLDLRGFTHRTSLNSYLKRNIDLLYITQAGGNVFARTPDNTLAAAKRNAQTRAPDDITSIVAWSALRAFSVPGRHPYAHNFDALAYLDLYEQQTGIHPTQCSDLNDTLKIWRGIGVTARSWAELPDEHPVHNYLRKLGAEQYAHPYGHVCKQACNEALKMYMLGSWQNVTDFVPRAFEIVWPSREQLEEDFRIHYIENDRKHRTLYKRIKPKLLLNPLHPRDKKVRIVKSFLKANELIYKEGPRAINGECPEVGLTIGPYTYHLLCQLAAAWNPCRAIEKDQLTYRRVDDITFAYFMCYGGKTNDFHLSFWMDRTTQLDSADYGADYLIIPLFSGDDMLIAVICGTHNMYLEADASRADQSQAWNALSFEYEFLNSFAHFNIDHTLDLLSRSVFAKLIFATQSGVIRVNCVAPTRITGSGDTALGNSVVFGHVAMWAITQALLVYVKPSGKQVVDIFTSSCYALGFKMDPVRYTGPLGVSFLAQCAIRCTSGRWIMVKTPAQVLKLGKSCTPFVEQYKGGEKLGRDVCSKAFARDQALALSHYIPTPFLTPIIEAMFRWSDGHTLERHDPLDRSLKYKTSGLFGSPKAVLAALPPECGDYFAATSKDGHWSPIVDLIDWYSLCFLRYGLSVQEVDEIADLLGKWLVPSLLMHRAFRKLMSEYT